VSEKSKDVIAKMLEKDPKKRVSLSEVLNHPVFAEENAQVLKNIRVSKKDLKKNFDLYK